jgi:hypothetical protein
VEAPVATSPETVTESLDDGAEPASRVSSLPEDLLMRVLAHTGDKRVVFVSNREDPDLRRKLSETFVFAGLDWCCCGPLLVESLKKKIGSGAYDMVLCATGFLGHRVDSALSHACRKAGIRFVRVNKGRPLACLMALARDLGLDEAGRETVGVAANAA